LANCCIFSRVEALEHVSEIPMSKVVLAAVMSAALGLALGVMLTFGFVDGDSEYVDGTFLGASSSGSDGVETDSDAWVPDYTPEEYEEREVDGEESLKPGVRRFSPSKASQKAIREAIATVRAPLPKRRDGVITGIILDEAGDPMVDVELSVRRSDYEEPPTGDDAAEQVQRYLERVRWQESTRQSQKTSREGRFQFNRVGNGRYQIEIKTEGLRIVHSDGRYIRNLEAGAEIELTLREQALLEIAVMLPSGKMADRADIVTVDVAGNQKTKKWFSTERVLELDPGYLRVGARIRGDENYRSEGFTEVTLSAGEKPERLVIKLMEEPTLRGNIVFQKGFPKRSVDLYYMRFDGEGLTIDELRKDGDRVVTEGDRFNAPLTESGRYAIGCYSRTAGLNSEVMIVQVGMKSKDVVVELIGLNRADYLEVDIRGPNGASVLRPRLAASILYREGERERTKRSRGGLIRRTDGKCWVEHAMLEEGQGPIVEYYVRVDCEFGTKKVTYRRGPSSSARVNFGEMATLNLRVTGSTDQEALASLDFDLRNEDGYRVAGNVGNTKRRRNADPMDIQQEASKKGEWFFAGLQPGDYKLSVNLGGNFRSKLLVKTEFSLRQGRNTETVELPPLYTVEVMLENGTAKSAQLKAIDAPRGSTIPSVRFANGDPAVFRNLLAGSYRMTVRINRKDMMKAFTLPGTSRLVFDGKDGRTLLVTRCREESMAYKAGVREGDVVVKLNGRGMSEWKEINLARVGPSKGQTQVITLERNGASRSVTLSREAYRQRGSPFRIR
jgi:hypothetical protein